MKSKEFLSALRVIIREEVSKSVRRELQSILTEQRTPATQPRVQERKVPVAKPKPKAPMFKDPVLNELLTSAAPVQYESHDPGVGYEEWPTMDYASAPRFGSMMQAFQQPGPINAAPDGMSIEQIEQVAPEVASALTRDYRSLIKAMDAKKGK